MLDFLLACINLDPLAIVRAGGYVGIALLVFAESGLLVGLFLPGDSLLFAVGAFAAEGSLHLWASYILLSIAAIAGDSVNYWVGNVIGQKAFSINNRFFKHDYLVKTERFYEKHGGKTIIIARFLPIIRTFAPFVAGVGKMHYSTFFFYNVVGGLLWVSLFIGAGYFFGNIPIVKENFETVILAIIFISVLPAIIEFIRHRFRH